MSRTRQLVNDWMLPGAIVLGISLYLVYYFTPGLHSHERLLHLLVSEGQRVVIATLLFFQFVKISPTTSVSPAGTSLPWRSRWGFFWGYRP